MIENEKIGNFLRELREQNGLSQQKLGRKVYVSRQAVSQWELGKCFPDLQTAILLSKIYNITIADIYAGEIINNKEKYNSVIEFIIKSEMKRIRKIITLLICIICVLLLIFLSYYFFNVYNKISIYTVDTIEEPYYIRGIVTKSVNDIYVNFELNETVDNLCLIFNDTKLNCMNNTNYLVIKESIGNNEQLPELSHLKMDNFINNVYVEINNNTKIKLNIEKDYNNDKLIFNKEDNTVNYQDKYSYNIDNIPDKVKNNFEYDEENRMLIKEINKKNQKNIIKYYVDSKIIEYQNFDNNNYKYWRYNFGKHKLEYYIESKNNGKITNEINSENQENYDAIKKEFETNVVDKYFN